MGNEETAERRTKIGDVSGAEGEDGNRKGENGEREVKRGWERQIKMELEAQEGTDSKQHDSLLLQKPRCAIYSFCSALEIQNS